MPNKKIRAFLAALWTVALLATLGSCGGGGGSASGGATPPPNPPVASAGTLVLQVHDVPTGATAVIRITGPGAFSRTLSQGETLSNLAVGVYTITADPLVHQGLTWHPAVSPAAAVNVVAGSTNQVEVRFTPDMRPALTTSVFVTGLEYPTFLTAPAGDPRQFIVERPGRIRIVRDGTVLATPFLDISDRVYSGGEGGLLSMAFAPTYSTSGVFYVYYTDTRRDIVVERFTVSSNPDRANPTGSYEIIRIPHPNFTNHFGGLVAFGPDGYLWMGTGDGGGAGDPPNNAQNKNVLLGKMLRLDVSQSTVGTPYRIPADNPFANGVGGRPEIWAYGLRNPWRFAFEPEMMVLPDVGQDRVEEINIVYPYRPGLNFGWDIMEGTECFGASTCDKTGLELPWIEYTQAATGGCSIIGGYVYHGKAFPELADHFFFSDFCGGFLKSFSMFGTMPTPQTTYNVTGLTGIVSFGRDSEGELYLLSSTGTVWKIVRKGEWDY